MRYIGMGQSLFSDIIKARSAAHNKKRYVNGKGMTPIIKNENSAKQTIRVFGADGTQIGSTYPKRAAGLVKKGRAHYVNDFDIRLNASDVTEITEDTKMDNNIITKEEKNRSYDVLRFNAREWSFNKACDHNVGSRSFMIGPDGELAEAFMIGDWSWNWTEILTKQLVLPKNTPHLFSFWLNGGENDNNNEVCRFEVTFNSDYESRYTYNLNRSFIRPVKRLNGWELYEIPFMTGDNEYTELRFVAQRAYMTVMAAKESSAYDELPDTADEFADERPQRHNIVFNDGWPEDKWYSTKNLRAKKENKQNNTDAVVPFNKPNGLSDKLEGVNGTLDAVNSTLNGVPSMISGVLGGVVNSCGFLHQKVLEAVANCGAENTDEISEMIMDSLDEKLSGLVDAISDNIDSMVDNISAMLDNVEEKLENVEDKLDEVKFAAEDM